MPSFANFNKALAAGQGKDQKSPSSTYSHPQFLPEMLHVDTSDLLTSVQSVALSSGTDRNAQEETQDPQRPPWHTSTPYNQSNSGFAGGHTYKIERMEEKRRLRSLGLITDFSSPIEQPTVPPVIMTTTPQKPETKRRSSWQPPMKGKLQKSRNKSREPEQRTSLDGKHFTTESYQTLPAPPQYSFSRIHNAPASPISSGTSTPLITPTREIANSKPQFPHIGRSSSSLGTVIGAASTAPIPSLGNLVEFYDPNSAGHTGQKSKSTATSQRAFQEHQPSNQEPLYFHQSRENVTPSPLFSNRGYSSPTKPAHHTLHASPTATSITNIPRGASSVTSLGSGISPTSAETVQNKPGFKPYEPRYAAKSHVTSTVPLSQAVKQDLPAIPFVHLDFTPPPKPFAKSSVENRRNNSETRLTTQEAKDYNAIAQATREAHVRIQSPSETSLASKSNSRPHLTPSRLSYEVRSTPTPDNQTERPAVYPKSILRKPVELSVDDIGAAVDVHSKKPAQSQANPVSRATPEPLREYLKNVPSEPVSPIQPPVEPSTEPERGRPKYSREDSELDLQRRKSVSARKSIDVETPSAKNFDISKYAQEKFQKPSQGKGSRAYPPVSYKAPAQEHSPSNIPEPTPYVPPVPPLPETSRPTERGLSTPPPIRSDNAIESSDEESLERPSSSGDPRRKSETRSKSKLSNNVTAIEDGPVRPRAPSMTEILKDLQNYDPDLESPEPSEGTDWLSQLFRGKKTDVKLPTSRPSSGISTPTSGMSPPLGKSPKKERDSWRSSRSDVVKEQRLHERAERQRLEVERKLQEAESEPSTTPRSPRFPRATAPVGASPDLRMGGELSSLRTTSTTSVDKVDSMVGGGVNIRKSEENLGNGTHKPGEKRPEAKRTRARPSSEEVRKQLGEMTPPHEREDWDSSTSPAPPQVLSINSPVAPTVAPLNIPAKPIAPGRLPSHGDPFPSTSTPARIGLNKDNNVEAKSSHSSLLSLEPKTLTKILVICCHCNRLHDPPSDIYRKMMQGNNIFCCPYCTHNLDILDCCSAYTSICNLIERVP